MGARAAMYRRGREENREFYTENKSPRRRRAGGSTSFGIIRTLVGMRTSLTVDARGSSFLSYRQLCRT